MSWILGTLKKDHQQKEPHAPQTWDAESEKREIQLTVQRLWNENGDKLSNQYAGTQSNISGVLEEGKQGFAGKFGQLVTGV